MDHYFTNKNPLLQGGKIHKELRESIDKNHSSISEPQRQWMRHIAFALKAPRAVFRIDTEYWRT